MSARLRFILFSVVAGLLATSPARLGGQVPSAPVPQAPTFRSDVEYVEVDAVVTNDRGEFVRGLTQDDFQVFEDGKPQSMSTFSVVDIPVERYERPLFAGRPIEPDVQQNERPFDGRVYILMLDNHHVSFLNSSLVRKAARLFIEQRVGANDLVAVVHIGGRVDDSQEFTSNKRLLLAAVEKFTGNKLRSSILERQDEYDRTAGVRAQNSPLRDVYDAERGQNARTTIEQLRNVTEWFNAVRGRKKTILFVSEGIDYDIEDVFGRKDASAIVFETQNLIRSAAKSNVTIYSIDPIGLGSLAVGDAEQQATLGAESSDKSLSYLSTRGLGSEFRLAQNSLRTVSEETGGFAVLNANGFDGAFERIQRENSSYYLLAYYPPNAKRDGKYHRIQVRVNRPGVAVRSRRGYAAPSGKPPVVKATDKRSPEIRQALDSPLQVAGLTMRVFAAPFRGPAPNASVLLGVEVRGRDLNLASNGVVELQYTAVDVRGKVKGGDTNRLTLNLRPDTRALVEGSVLRFLNRMELAPGRYQVRVAGHDTVGGASGSVIYDLEVPDFYKAPFSVSGLVLTSLGSPAGVTVKMDDALKDVLPAPPVGERTFARGDELALFAEVYDNNSDRPHSVDIVTTVTADDGQVQFKAAEERASSELQGQRGGYGYVIRVPLSDLQPGLYVLAVEARSRTTNLELSRREIQFRVADQPR